MKDKFSVIIRIDMNVKSVLLKRGFLVKHKFNRKFVGGALYNKSRRVADVKPGQQKQNAIININPNKTKRLNLKL